VGVSSVECNPSHSMEVIARCRGLSPKQQKPVECRRQSSIANSGDLFVSRIWSDAIVRIEVGGEWGFFGKGLVALVDDVPTSYTQLILFSLPLSRRHSKRVSYPAFRTPHSTAFMPAQSSAFTSAYP
jgi:hypothetical protein